MSQGVFFRTHIINKGIIDEFDRMKASGYSVYLSVDNTNRVASGILRPAEDTIFVTNQQMEKLNIGFDTFWGNPEHFLVWALDKYDFDYYWLIEYDVRFNGKWKDFFDHYIESPADMLATWIRKRERDPWYPHWDSMNWDVPFESQLAVFFPVVRLSRRSLLMLREKYLKGRRGYCEVVVPTLVVQSGFTLHDLSQSKQFYNSDTWTYRPERSIDPNFQNYLFHPVYSSGSVPNKHRIFI